MTSDIKSIISNHLPIDVKGDKAEHVVKRRPEMVIVDSLVDELVKEYDNPGFRRWYCGVIYEFGLDRVGEWRRRASDGKTPARLFSAYVKQAYKYKSRGSP
jgi:hypothetical protein